MANGWTKAGWARPSGERCGEFNKGGEELSLGGVDDGGVFMVRSAIPGVGLCAVYVSY